MQKTTLADYQAAHFLWEAADGVALRPGREQILVQQGCEGREADAGGAASEERPPGR